MHFRSSYLTTPLRKILCGRGVVKYGMAMLGCGLVNYRSHNSKTIEILAGPNGARLPIVDGPTALGYIFSIATPTVEVPSMAN